MQFHVLGPLEVSTDGSVLPLGTRKQRQVLALLAVYAGQVVRRDDFVEELWPTDPPSSAVANVSGYVGNLRRLFASAELQRDRLVRRGSGYLLQARPDELDLLAFTAAAAQGHDDLRRGELRAAAAQFRAALACWTGSMLAGMQAGPVLTVRCSALDDERSAIVEELASVQLRLDEPREAVALLREHVRAHPLRERGHLLLVRSLYRLGDLARALAAYADCRAVLKDQLGIEPGPELQALHRAALNRDVDPVPLVGPPAAPPSVAARSARHVPAQLPLDVLGFAGRADELRKLDAALDTAQEQPTAVVISALSGTAGVGKTALAVHWAHRVCYRFPDGQLYLNLRGFDPSGTPTSPAEATRILLESLGMPPDRIPADPQAQTGLYRSVLSGKRVLVLLDNARDTEQVRPLLPGSPGCLAVVTSRDRLVGLVVVEGVRPVMVDLLSAAEARALLTRRLGQARVAAEPRAVDDLVAACSRLPLALGIVAARAAIHPSLPLSRLADELARSGGDLSAFDGGDAPTDARTVFSWSYRTLSPGAARLFRLLGLHPGPDLAPPAAASLAELPLSPARTLLAELARANLVVEDASGRYSFHDLLRAYATELAQAHDRDGERRKAVSRMLDHYLHTAYAADRLLYPHRESIQLGGPRRGVTLGRLADADQARCWFVAERRVLLATVDLAVDAGLDGHAWRIPWALTTFFNRQGHWHDWASTQRTALAAAQRLGDLFAQATCQRGLGNAYARLGRYDAALVHLGHAFELYGALEDLRSQAIVQRSVARVFELQHRYDEALARAELGLELSRAGDDPRMASTLNAVGFYRATTGDYPGALVCCEQALALFQERGDRHGEGYTWDSLGLIHYGLRQYDRAAACYARAAELCHEVGERYYQAATLVRLGDTYGAMNAAEPARTAWRRALDILTDLDHPDAEQVRHKLHEPARSAPSPARRIRA